MLKTSCDFRCFFHFNVKKHRLNRRFLGEEQSAKKPQRSEATHGKMNQKSQLERTIANARLSNRAV